MINNLFPKQDNINAKLEIYDEVYSSIKQERLYRATSGNIPYSEFVHPERGHFGEDEIPYIKAVVNCVMENKLDMNPSNYRQYNNSYCFICTSGICLRFQGFMWEDLLYYVHSLRQKC